MIYDYKGMDKTLKKRVTITTWQSVYNEPKEWFSRFGACIGDEAHHFKAKSLTTLMENCLEAKFRIGTTGTIDDIETNVLTLEGIFGQIEQVKTTHELIDEGVVSNLHIQCLSLKYDKSVRKKRTYQEEIKFLTEYAPRNKLIANLAVDQDGNTLVLFKLVEKHGKPLFRLIRSMAKSGQNVFYVSGETDVDTREQIRAIVETETNAIIVASMGTFSTGINIRNLHNLIMAAPSKSKIKILQSIGRILRLTDDDIDVMKVFDISDNLTTKSWRNYSFKHAADRITMYSKEKFNFNVFEIDLPHF
jgi:superfamily II DNA or RNA helicase